MSRHRTGGWSVTGDGTFWGGVLALIIWGSVMAVLSYSVLQRVTEA